MAERHDTIVVGGQPGLAMSYYLQQHKREHAPDQKRGVTKIPGLYFLGLHWMHTFGSGLPSYVGRDAAYIAGHMDSAARD